jgi:2,3-dihydro-2,3-dihydroxybenzoate dehydrogenase
MTRDHAVVVGGARGIGAAIARRLADGADIARVTVADVDGEQARELAESLDGAEGVAVDITDAAEVERLVSKTKDASRVAIASGVFLATPSLEVSRDEFERILRVNLVGVYDIARLYAAEMVERQDGAIVAVASIAATLPRMRQAAYCASKAGVRQALRVLALETVPQGVRINFVSPGPTDTPMLRELAKDHPSVDSLAAGSSEAFRPRIPSGRVARPEDIAEATAFLLSPASKHIALRDLVVDGGELLGV